MLTWNILCSMIRLDILAVLINKSKNIEYIKNTLNMKFGENFYFNIIHLMNVYDPKIISIFNNSIQFY